MSALSTVILPDVLRSINAAIFNGTYQAVGTALSFASRIVKFQNNTNQGCLISWDGINDNEFLPAGSFLLIDVAMNRENSVVFDVQKGTQFYVKSVLGSGTFYISTYYGK